MRQIKFRAWDADNNLMIYSDDPLYLFMCGRNGEIGCWERDDEHLNDLHIEQIMQYTGLKDRNGHEIFEGDIVKWASDGMPHTIEWSEPNAGFAIVSTSDGITLYEFDMSDLHEAEVIGNVWQNPELLEVSA